jgi:hypothetical protein
VGIADLVDNVQHVREAVTIGVYTPLPFNNNGGHSTRHIIIS